ncbi:MAG: hypothetical protein U0271_43765 [Polyangiaceae bacterium]
MKLAYLLLVSMFAVSLPACEKKSQSQKSQDDDDDKKSEKKKDPFEKVELDTFQGDYVKDWQAADKNLGSLRSPNRGTRCPRFARPRSASASRSG